jgi:tryptophan-rich sensory protein
MDRHRWLVKTDPPCRWSVRSIIFPHMLQSIPSLIAWIMGTSLAAISGAVTAKESGAFYAMMQKPSWAPPAWLFGPAWTLLYILMGTAAWRVWRDAGFRGAKVELACYALQLALNMAWSYFFFVRRTGLGATIEVVCLWLSVAVTLVLFWRRDQIAGVLFVPYLAWVTFATALTVSVWRRNPTLL